MTRRALLIMAKRPSPGQTKTRLSPPLTPAQAAALYECFLRDVVDTVRTISGIAPIIAFSPVGEAGYFRQLAPDFDLIPQQGNTLGDRLDFVLRRALEMGFEQVAAINSDSPTLPARYLAQAFAELAKPAVDLAFGPCEDGGYYLIGWKRPYSPLVRRVQMSTPHVLRDTLSLAREAKLRTVLLPPWYDVDDIAGLERVKAASGAGRHTRAFLAQWLPLP